MAEKPGRNAIAMLCSRKPKYIVISKTDNEGKVVGGRQVVSFSSRGVGSCCRVAVFLCSAYPNYWISKDGDRSKGVYPRT